MSKFKENLEEAKGMRASAMVSKLKESVINKLFEKNFSHAGRFQARVDLLTTLGKVACMDREVSKLERDYIIQKASKLLHEDNKEELGQQFDLVANIIRRNLKASDYIPYHVANLLKTAEDNLEGFLKIIIGLIAADGESEKREEYFIETIAEISGYDNRQLSELILNCRYQVEVFLNKETKITKEEAKEKYDIPTIKIDFE